jgi:uncharacterized protein (TIGR03000 family)
MYRSMSPVLGVATAAFAALLCAVPAQGQVPVSRYDWPPRYEMNRVDWTVPPSTSYPPGPLTYYYGPAGYSYAPRTAPRPYYVTGYPSYSSYVVSDVAAPADAVVVDVHVPTPGARVWFDGAATRQTGTERLFASPPLKPGKDYHYTVRARWTANGRPVERTRVVAVRAGERVAVDFSHEH